MEKYKSEMQVESVYARQHADIKAYNLVIQDDVMVIKTIGLIWDNGGLFSQAVWYEPQQFVWAEVRVAVPVVEHGCHTVQVELWCAQCSEQLKQYGTNPPLVRLVSINGLGMQNIWGFKRI